MAKTTKKVQGRRVMPAVRRHGARARTLTLGELIAAAYDVSNGDSKRAAKILSSREMAEALGRRIIVD